MNDITFSRRYSLLSKTVIPLIQVAFMARKLVETYWVVLSLTFSIHRNPTVQSLLRAALVPSKLSTEWRERNLSLRGQTNDKCSWSLFVSVTSCHDNTFYIIFILLCSSLSWKSNGLILNIVQSNFWFGVIGKCRLSKLYCIAKSLILHTLIGTSI